MHRPDHSTADPNGISAGVPGYTEGDATATPPVARTIVTDDQMNDTVEGLCQLVEGAGIALVKNDYSQILDAIRWFFLRDALTSTTLDNTTDTTFSSVVGVNGHFLAGNSTNGIEFSHTGENWTGSGSGSSVSKGFAYDGTSLYVACGDGGQILTATDPEGTWTSRTSGTANNLGAVAHDGTTFVAVGVSGTIISSTDGISWTTRTAAGSYTGQFRDIVFAEGLFVAVGDNEIQTSPDGTTWTSRYSATDDHYAVAHNGTNFVTTGTSALVKSSPDGITWTTRSFATGMAGTVRVDAYGEAFIAVGQGTNIQISRDGITWEQGEFWDSGSSPEFALANGCLAIVSSSGVRRSSRTMF